MVIVRDKREIILLYYFLYLHRMAAEVRPAFQDRGKHRFCFSHSRIKPFQFIRHNLNVVSVVSMFNLKKF
uniref:Uncharacterized protein n=1 Tax=Magallana gigas TaxID=29159 RepID=K1PS87_MAGGI